MGRNSQLFADAHVANGQSLHRVGRDYLSLLALSLCFRTIAATRGSMMPVIQPYETCASTVHLLMRTSLETSSVPVATATHPFGTACDSGL